MRIEKSKVLFASVVGLTLLASWGLASNYATLSGKNVYDSESIKAMSWLVDWQYRKEHNITGSTAGVQINYPMMLNVHYDNGFDIEGEVYLAGKCRHDFGDVRFTDFGGTNLDYWIQQKTDGVNALFWIEINHIPADPNFTTIYIYYGNPNATTTSNKDWVFPFYTDFEDETKQGWQISWATYVTFDGVSTIAYRGNYSRTAGRIYGANAAGNGHFYEKFQKNCFLTSGSYRMEGAAKFWVQDSYKIPQEIKFKYNDMTISAKTTPGTQWHWMAGNFTIISSEDVIFEVEFHLFTTSGLSYGDQTYSIDSVFVRKWCDPEPQHADWGSEEVSSDKTPPEIVSIEWTPTCPYPFVYSSAPRHREPILFIANITEEENGSGIEYVKLAYRTEGGEWWYTNMIYNTTLSLWVATIPGQEGNTTIDYYITTSDKAGNTVSSSLDSLYVKPLIIGDIDGDGEVTILDVVKCTIHYGETSP